MPEMYIIIIGIVIALLIIATAIIFIVSRTAFLIIPTNKCEIREKYNVDDKQTKSVDDFLELIDEVDNRAAKGDKE
jgi:hypothetical protein